MIFKVRYCVQTIETDKSKLIYQVGHCLANYRPVDTDKKNVSLLH